MITIIHGEDIVASRAYYNSLKTQFKNFYVLQADTITLTELKQLMEGGSLFASSVAVFIDDFFTKKKATSSESKDIISYVTNAPKSVTVNFWEGKQLTSVQLKLIKGAQVTHYPLPMDIFAFIDSLFSASTNDRIKLFHKAMQNSEVEFIFFMLIRQVRLLLSSKQQDAKKIDELLRLAPWQTKKIQTISQNLSESLLKKVYAKLFLLDVAQKTGNLPLPLLESLDFFLLEF